MEMAEDCCLDCWGMVDGEARVDTGPGLVKDQAGHLHDPCSLGKALLRRLGGDFPSVADPSGLDGAHPCDRETSLQVEHPACWAYRHVDHVVPCILSVDHTVNRAEEPLACQEGHGLA